MTKTIFALVADALRKELEPQGFNIHVRTNHGEIRITDISTPDSRLTWTFGIVKGPEV